MAERRIDVIVTTPEGEITTQVTASTIERLRVQREMLKEYGSDPMMETDEGEYLIVKDIQRVVAKR